MIDNNLNQNDDYEYISSHFRNEATIVLEKTAAIYLEGEEDQYFWKNVFDYALPNSTYEFYFNSNLLAAEKSEHRSGSGECKKFFAFSDSKFLICIDSDYNYLLSHNFLDDYKFVFQTYTYSMENHYCYSKNLTKIALALTAEIIIDFDQFMIEFSKSIFELFVYSVYSLSEQDETFSLKEFQQLLKIENPFDFTDNGKIEIEKLKTIVDAKLEGLILEYDSKKNEIEELKKELQKKNLTSETTYLFVKGHALIDLVKINRPKIINSINRQLKNTMSKNEYLAILRNQICFNGYWQIVKLIKDLKGLLI